MTLIALGNVSQKTEASELYSVQQSALKILFPVAKYTLFLAAPKVNMLILICFWKPEINTGHAKIFYLLDDIIICNIQRKLNSFSDQNI